MLRCWKALTSSDPASAEPTPEGARWRRPSAASLVPSGCTAATGSHDPCNGASHAAAAAQPTSRAYASRVGCTTVARWQDCAVAVCPRSTAAAHVPKSCTSSSSWPWLAASRGQTFTAAASLAATAAFLVTRIGDAKRRGVPGPSAPSQDTCTCVGRRASLMSCVLMRDRHPGAIERWQARIPTGSGSSVEAATYRQRARF
jgi:hypothetical protein